MVAAVVMVWLVGAVVGWCAGWAARGEQNRSWHRDTTRQLAQTRARLAEALDQLDCAHTARWHVERVSPPAAPAVVHVHMAAPLPWAPQPPMITPTGAHDGMPMLAAHEVAS